MIPSGLYYSPEYVSSIHSNNCIGCTSCFIKSTQDKQWSKELNRRTMHFGSRYDYKSRKLINDVSNITTYNEINLFATHLIPVFGIKPTQVIINEYTSNQKISPHIDHPILFGEIIATLSLGSSMIMKFSHETKESYSIKLNNGDLVLLSGEARYDYKHELLPVNEKDFYRISFTYRTIK